MKVVDVNKLYGTDRDCLLDCDGFRSLRPILERDGMGFTVCKTIIPAGPERKWHYTKHLEACYCVSGSGVLRNCFTGETHVIEKDVIYILDNHDEHTFQAVEDIVLISVFNPPLIGQEKHKEDGSYE